jgi:hypothetical protein
VAVAIILVFAGKVAIDADPVAVDVSVSSAVPGSKTVVALVFDKVITPLLAIANNPRPTKFLVPLVLIFKLLKVTGVVVFKLVMVWLPAPLNVTDPPVAMNVAGVALLVKAEADTSGNAIVPPDWVTAPELANVAENVAVPASTLIMPGDVFVTTPVNVIPPVPVEDAVTVPVLLSVPGKVSREEDPCVMTPELPVAPVKFKAPAPFFVILPAFVNAKVNVIAPAAVRLILPVLAGLTENVIVPEVAL